MAICEESIKALSEADHKISFDIRKARMEIFQGYKAADEVDTEEVDDDSRIYIFGFCILNLRIKEDRSTCKKIVLNYLFLL